ASPPASHAALERHGDAREVVAVRWVLPFGVRAAVRIVPSIHDPLCRAEMSREHPGAQLDNEGVAHATAVEMHDHLVDERERWGRTFAQLFQGRPVIGDALPQLVDANA